MKKLLARLLLREDPATYQLKDGSLAHLLPDSRIPLGLYALYQMMFAIITPALFIGAIVGRVRLPFLAAFIIGWSFLVYYPLVHMVWGGGILQYLGTLDFAGGTVVHVNAGMTAFALSILSTTSRPTIMREMSASDKSATS